jgi:hypothetical protein
MVHNPPTFMEKSLRPLHWPAWVLVVHFLTSCTHSPEYTGTKSARPVLWYCLYFNAPGENRYAPDGVYSRFLTQLRGSFDVRISAERPTSRTLQGVDVLLVANPNDKAFGTNLPPPHVNDTDIATLTHYVDRGGGLILMGNQENHNLEITDVNQLLQHWGLQFVNNYTDAKKLVLPPGVATIGGLRWAYYTGNQIVITQGHPARPIGWVANDLTQRPEKGPRDEPGVLLARAEPGRGRVVVVTDSGWLTNNALDEIPIGDVVIRGQDNFEIFRRLAFWAGGR